MTLLIRYCPDCNQAFPCVDLACPVCGEERRSYDAGKLIEQLGERPTPGELAPDGNLHAEMEKELA